MLSGIHLSGTKVVLCLIFDLVFRSGFLLLFLIMYSLTISHVYICSLTISHVYICSGLVTLTSPPSLIYFSSPLILLPLPNWFPSHYPVFLLLFCDTMDEAVPTGTGHYHQ